MRSIRDSKVAECSSDHPANVYRKPATWTEESHEWVSRMGMGTRLACMSNIYHLMPWCVMHDIVPKFVKIKSKTRSQIS